jgi:hypothetical protein
MALQKLAPRLGDLPAAPPRTARQPRPLQPVVRPSRPVPVDRLRTATPSGCWASTRSRRWWLCLQGSSVSRISARMEKWIGDGSSRPGASEIAFLGTPAPPAAPHHSLGRELNSHRDPSVDPQHRGPAAGFAAACDESSPGNARLKSICIWRLFIMRPEPQHLHDALCFKHLVNKPMLDVDPP